MKNLDPRRARWMRLRIGILVTLMALGASRLVSAAWGLQVDRHDALEADCERQYSPRLRLAPRRGTIFDRHHRPLPRLTHITPPSYFDMRHNYTITRSLSTPPLRYIGPHRFYRVDIFEA